MNNKNQPNDNDGRQGLVLDTMLPSVVEVSDEEGFTERQLREAKDNNFAERIKVQYANLYRIVREDFEFTSGYKEKADLELLAEFDSVSQDLLKFSGWLDTRLRDISGNYPYTNRSFAELNLTPLKSPEGLIYHMKGTLEWTCTRFDWKNRVIPISIVPVYGAPSGKIIALKATNAKIGHSTMFDSAKVEYRSFDVKFGDE